MKGTLLLEDGAYYIGNLHGYHNKTIGELVFTTAMIGYQQTITDPSYFGQIVVFTAAHIGTIGINDKDNESNQMQAAGMIINNISDLDTHYESNMNLSDYLINNKKSCLSGIDIRSLVIKLRRYGVCRAMVLPYVINKHTLDNAITNEISMIKNYNIDIDIKIDDALNNQLLSKLKNIRYDYKQKIENLYILDFGIKESIIKQIKENSTYKISVFKDINKLLESIIFLNGNVIIFISNGAGDPRNYPKEIINSIQGLLFACIPIFGICLGHQLICLALGLKIKKLKYGHRGINHPVINRNGNVLITTHNHGYVLDIEPFYKGNLDTKFGKFRVTYYSLHDGINEGIQSIQSNRYCSSVQYHPEGEPGTCDGYPLFKDFLLMN